MNWIQTKFLALLLRVVKWLFTLRYGTIPAKNDIEGWRVYLQKIVNGNDIALLVLLTKTKIDDYTLVALKFACSTQALFQTAWVLAFNQKSETQKNETQKNETEIEPEPEKTGLIQRILNRFTVLKTQLTNSEVFDIEKAAEVLRTIIPENTNE